MASSLQSFRDPVRIVLSEQTTIGSPSCPIRLRIAPAIEQVASLAGSSPRAPRGLHRGRAVIDDPDLAEIAEADDDLVEVGVVGDRVEVRPVGAAGTTPPAGGRVEVEV